MLCIMLINQNLQKLKAIFHSLFIQPNSNLRNFIEDICGMEREIKIYNITNFVYFYFSK